MAGGFNIAHLTRSLSLNASFPSCPTQLANYPLGVNAAVAVSVGGTPVVCGGTNPFTNACYMYNIQANMWNTFSMMGDRRAWAMAAQLNKDDFWVLGEYMYIKFILENKDSFCS